MYTKSRTIPASIEYFVTVSIFMIDCPPFIEETEKTVIIPIQDSTTSAFQLNCRKAEFSSSLAFLCAAALSSSDTFPRRADILALMLSTWWLFCCKYTKAKLRTFLSALLLDIVVKQWLYSVWSTVSTFLMSSSPLAHTSFTLSLCTVKSVSNASCFFSKPC